MTTIANIQSVQEEKHPMSSASFNQFHNEDLQEQINTAAAAQELSDAELESVAGGISPIINVIRAASSVAKAIGSDNLANPGQELGLPKPLPNYESLSKRRKGFKRPHG